MLPQLGFYVHHSSHHQHVSSHHQLTLQRWCAPSKNVTPPFAHRIVGVASIVFRDATRSHVLTVFDRFDELWSLPGGVVDPGETLANTAVREVWEETGVRVELQAFVGIMDVPSFAQPSNFGTSSLHVLALCARARGVGTEVNFDPEESTACQWMPSRDFVSLPATRVPYQQEAVARLIDPPLRDVTPDALVVEEWLRSGRRMTVLATPAVRRWPPQSPTPVPVAVWRRVLASRWSVAAAGAVAGAAVAWQLRRVCA